MAAAIYYILIKYFKIIAKTSLTFRLNASVKENGFYINRSTKVKFIKLKINLSDHKLKINRL